MKSLNLLSALGTGGEGLAYTEAVPTPAKPLRSLQVVAQQSQIGTPQGIVWYRANRLLRPHRILTVTAAKHNGCGASTALDRAIALAEDFNKSLRRHFLYSTDGPCFFATEGSKGR